MACYLIFARTLIIKFLLSGCINIDLWRIHGTRGHQTKWKQLNTICDLAIATLRNIHFSVYSCKTIFL